MGKQKRKISLKAPRVKGQQRQRSFFFSKEALIIFSIIAIAGVWRLIIHEMMHDTVPSSVLTSEWKRYSPGGTPLSLLLPSEPSRENTSIAEATDSTIKQVERSHLSIEKLNVAVWNITYADGTPTDIRRSAEGAAETLKQLPGVTDYKDEKINMQLSGRQSVLIRGSFVRDGDKMNIEAILIGEKEKLWQVIVTYPAYDRNGSFVSKKILDSIQIK
jgi:hypothetical protein